MPPGYGTPGSIGRFLFKRGGMHCCCQSVYGAARCACAAMESHVSTAGLSSSLPDVIRDTMVGLVRQHGADLSARQLSVLLICFLEDGPHTVRELAERLGVAKHTIARIVDRLERFELVRSAPDPRDRRSMVVSRTAPGAAYVSHVRSLMEAAARRQRPPAGGSPSNRGRR